MAKTKAQAVRRERAARPADPERWTRLLVISGVVVVVALAIGIIAFGWYWTQVRPLGKTVLQVGDTKYSLGHLERRMKITLEENPIFLQSQEYVQLLPSVTLDELEREAKLLEAADEIEGITVTGEELDAKVLEKGEGTVLAEELSRQVRDSGLSEGEYLQMVRAEILEEKVREHFTSAVPESEPQTRARLVFVAEEDEAEAALERIDGGEDFAAVASDVSQDTATAEQGGEIDWFPRGGRADLPRDVEEFLFEDAAAGEHSEVIAGVGGAYIVQLLERDEERELTDEQKPLVAERLVQEWFEGLNTQLVIERTLSDDDAIRALNEVLS